ncbi:hypothetical protein GZB42_004253 [Salmonella enterica]|nr:hypothetical protein [Salmonella enterica]
MDKWLSAILTSKIKAEKIYIKLLDLSTWPCSLAALQPCSLAALQPCSLAALQPCSLAALQPCSLAGMKSERTEISTMKNNSFWKK